MRIVTWSPTIDPEALKTLSMRMVNEAKVRLLLHAWCAAPMVEDAVVRGAIFASKEGRHAVLARSLSIPRVMPIYREIRRTL